VAAEGVTYREDFGLWWPDYDHNPPKCFNKVRLQINAMDATIAASRGFDLCIQAGGHAGMWADQLARVYKRVVTFEPDPALFACMEKNLAGRENIEMHEKALGREVGTVLMMPHPSAGSWYVSERGRVFVEQTYIDSLDLPACDAIILDIEGYEAEALAGAAQTIKKFRPVLHLEILPRARDAIMKAVERFGYVFRVQVHSDSIFVPG
jgi:FkbM family methyltransferase